MTWYNDGNEGEVMRDILNKFEAQNPGIKVVMDTVAFKDIHNILQAQVEAGSPPDLARVTDQARFIGKYLDLRPYLKGPNAWSANWSDQVLGALRKADDKQGLYGFPSQFTVTGPFINRTLFQQANIPVPSDTKDKVTWDEWIDAAKKVAAATRTPYAVAMDRSGHRFWSPSISMCAKYVDPSTGKFTVDSPGFRKAANMLISWHKDKITPPEVWAGGGGGYAAANDFFTNGQLVFYQSGSWQISQFQKQIGDKFEWDAVPTPTGDCGSTAIPGGAYIVAFAASKHPKEVGMLVDYLTREDVLGDLSARSLFLPGHIGLAKKGIHNPSNSKQLNVFLSQIPNIQPEAYTLQYHPLGPTLNTEIRDRLSQVIVGELTLDDAIKRVQDKMDTAQAQQK